MAGSPHRFLYLLASQLSLMVLFPFVTDERPRPRVAAVLIVFVYGAALWAVAAERRTRQVATVLAVPAIVSLLVSVPVGNHVSVPSVGFGIVFFAFITAVIFHGVVAARDFTFFSFITLTSVGYGDIVPLTGHAKSLAMLEAVTGQMYLAIFIARLVGLHAQRRTE